MPPPTGTSIRSFPSPGRSSTRGTRSPCDVPLVPRARWAYGGSGSILATLAAGLPTLLVPRGADQSKMRAFDLGAGLVLMPGEVTGGAVRDAVATLLEFPAYRHRALDVAAEIAAVPEPRDVARRLGGAVAV